MSVTKRIVVGLGLFSTLALGSCLGLASFKKIRKMRELERVPPTQALAVLPGEVNITGQVAFGDKGGLTSPNRHRPCVYYHYLVERKETDSDGNTKWVTERSETKYANFDLVDESGRVRIRPGPPVDWTVATDWSVTQGDRRYTESRLDPNDRVFLFGYGVERPGGAMEILFDQEGRYTPIVSQDGEMGERRGMATASLFLCWAGLVALSFTVLFACMIGNMHQLLVYLILVAGVLGVLLGCFGLAMVSDDLTSARDRLARHRTEASRVITRDLKTADISWDGTWGSLGSFDDPQYAAVPPSGRARLSRIRLDVVRATRRTNGLRDRFPESWVAPLVDVDEEQEPLLPAADQAAVETLDATFAGATVNGWLALILGILALVLAVLMTRWGFGTVKQKRMIENIPTTPTAGAAWGPLEIVGRIEKWAGEELAGPLSGAACVQYHYKVQELRGSGKNSRWVTIEDTQERIGFLCVDDDGSIEVDPRGAEIHTHHSTGKREGRLKYSETRLELGDPVYGLGYAKVAGEDADHLQLQEGEGFPYLLANIGERELMLRKSRSGMLKLNLALCGAVLFGLMIFGGIGSFGATDYIAAALFAPAYLTVLFFMLLFNDLIFLRNRVDQTWSNIDVALQKRADLIPALLTAVKGYMSHEQDLLKRLSEMRGGGGGGGVVSPIGVVAPQVMPMLLTAIERYPTMKADANFRSVMTALTRVENELSFMRGGYNLAVERYNLRIEHFPEILLARLFKFTPREYFTAEFEVHAVPKIDFDQ